MEFLEAIPVMFKEIIPNNNIPEKWKEITLNTGGTHSTLQDIKLPQKAGGYWYEDSKKLCTRNRFLYWQTLSDGIELAEASLDVNLSGAYLRCKVATGTPPLSSITINEHLPTNSVVVLTATVSSVHRLTFPHPTVLDKKISSDGNLLWAWDSECAFLPSETWQNWFKDWLLEDGESTFGSLSSTSPSIFVDTSAINNPNNYHILSQYSNATTGVAHTCASLLRQNGEAVFALAYGYSGEGGLLLVKLPVTGSAITTVLKRESTVPRFLSGITGALRGKSSNDGVETYEVVITHGFAVAICGDTCLRAWSLDDGGAPVAISAPLTQTVVRPKAPPHGHMLQKTDGQDGSITLVAYLSFPNECEFVVIRMHYGGVGAVRFSHICRIFGPQLDLLDYAIGYGDGNNVIWALWSQPNGDTIITSSAVSAEASWRAVAARDLPPPLPQLSNHQQYRDRLLAPGLFPHPVIRKALAVYKRTWCSGAGVVMSTGTVGAEGDIGESAMSAVTARVAHLAARATLSDQSHLIHKCWADLYSWCLQYMETLQKPLGLMISKQGPDVDCGWWCAVVRRVGISLVCELEPLERMLLSPEAFLHDSGGVDTGELSADAVRVVVAGARWEQSAGAACAADLERRLFACPAPQHRLLPRLLHLLRVPTAPQDPTPTPTLTPQQIDELKTILESIKDLHIAVLELNNALRLDVPECDTSKMEADTSDGYDSLFASDLGVAIVTEAIRQMAELRCRALRGVLAALGLCRGAGDVPGAGHCAVHWQAYRALLWLRTATLQPPKPSSSEGFRLKLSALEAVCSEVGSGLVGAAGGVMHAYVASAGGARARARLQAAAVPVLWHQSLSFFTYHLAHQLWAVSGGFEFGSWLATINQPRLVHNYVTLLEPWCERNACSRQFILGLALLDLEDSEGAYAAFCKAAKGVSTETFLRQLVSGSDCLTHHQALVIYYMKVIKLFEIHDAGACVVRLAETAISIADKDDPNLPTCQWVVFKWHLSGGRTARALSAAAACSAPHARAAAAAALLTALGERGELGALVRCAALAGEAERAAAARAKLIDAHAHNPYYDFLYALHLSRHHYRKAAAVMYERAARARAEGEGEGAGAAAGQGAARRRWLAAALTCLRLAKPEHAFIACPALGTSSNKLQVIGPEELAAELREEDGDSLDAVQQALLKGENIDFDKLYTILKAADPETLLAVTKRAISTSQFLPRWFLQQYMEVDGSGCVRALLGGGRACEAGAACCEALRRALAPVAPPSPHLPRAAPLSLADLLLAELLPHIRHPYVKQIYDELDFLVKEYTQVVIRNSEDMKLAAM